MSAFVISGHFAAQLPCPLYPESGHWSARQAPQPWMLRMFSPAIRLSRKDWLFRADRAVLCLVRGAGCASESCPAGFFAEVGFGGGGDGRCTTEGDRDDQRKIEA